MAAPKIKLYRLSRDFTTDSLNRDKKTETNDELLPVFDKYVSPDDILAKMPAVGVLPSEGKFVEKLTPIFSMDSAVSRNISRLTANLVLQDFSNSNSLSISASESDVSNSFSYSGSNSLNSGIYKIELTEDYEGALGSGFKFDFCMNEGVYPIIRTSDGQVVPDDGWFVDDTNGELTIRAVGVWNYYVFEDVTFMNNSSGVSHLYCTKYAPIYTGENSYFEPYVFVLKDGVEPRYKDNIVDGISVLDNHDTEMIFFRRALGETIGDDEDYMIIQETGEVVLSESMVNQISDKDLYINYVSLAYNGKKYKDTKRFVANAVNLIPQNDEEGTSGGHLFMGPDVFLGKKQYEPSSYESDTGEVVTIGIVPAYVEPGNYTFSHRNGYVTFPAKVNSNPELDTADYSWNIDNLTYTKNGTYTKVGGSVHISHAHICCVENVNNQVFERYYSYDDINGDNSNSISSSDIMELRSGDVVFKASSLDYRYSKSIGAPWVKRNSTYMPTRVYVTYKKYKDSSNSLSDSSSDSLSNSEREYEVVTEVKPQVITIPNYDELTVKTGE